MKKLIGLMVFAGLLFNPFPAMAGIETGEPAPNFTLPGVDGENYTLADQKGSYVVLEWINPDCPFVKKHYGSGNMQSIQEAMTGEGVVWYSVASSAPGNQGYYTADEWKSLNEKKNSRATQVLLDPDGKVGKLYSAKTTPHMFLINPSGTLIYQGAIDSMATANPADIPLSHNYVVEAFEQATAGEEVKEPSTRAYGCSVKY